MTPEGGLSNTWTRWEGPPPSATIPQGARHPFSMPAAFARPSNTTRSAATQFECPATIRPSPSLMTPLAIAAEIQDGTGRSTFTYDSLNRRLTAKDPAGNAITYSYDAVGARAEMIAPGGGRFTYAYTALGAIDHLSNPQGDRTSYSYDADGRRTRRSWPTAPGPATATIWRRKCRRCIISRVTLSDCRIRL